jgi:uncharacterized repeat protein (TIGR01451 family)
VTATGPSSVLAGTNATYTFTITNAGPNAAQNFVLTDALPTGSTFVSITGGGANPDTFFYTQSGGTLTVTSSSIAAGNTDTLTIVVSAPSSLANGANFSDTVSVTSATTDPNTANNSATVTGSVVNSADLGVTATGPSSVPAGTNATYTFTITNAGPTAAQNFVLTDALPTGSTFVSITDGAANPDTFFYTQSGGTLTVTSSSIAAGNTDTLTIVVFAPSNLPNGANFSDTVSVSSASFDPNTANNSATVTGSIVNTPASADLAVTNTGPATSTEGNNLSYTVTVTNNGPSAATSVVLTDTLGSNLRFVSATAGQGSFTQSGGVVTFSVGSVASGASVTFTVTAQALEDGSLTNAATVSSATGDPNSGNNSASATTAVAEPAIVVSAPITEKNRRVSGVVVATFTHANGVEPASAFVATINWGDGTTSVGNITLSGTTYRVKGSHTYAQSGTHTVTTTVTEPGAAPNLATTGTSGGRSNTAVSKPTEFATDQLSIAMSGYLPREKQVSTVPSGILATVSTSLPRPGSDGRSVAVSGSAVGSWNPAVDAAFRILAGEAADSNDSDSYSIPLSHFGTLFDFKPSHSI